MSGSQDNVVQRVPRTAQQNVSLEEMDILEYGLYRLSRFIGFGKKLYHSDSGLEADLLQMGELADEALAECETIIKE